MAALTATNISFIYGDTRILNDVSLSVSSSEVVAIIGASCSGKSTLLKIAAGLLKPSDGLLNRPEVGKTGFVFQSPELLQWRSALDNVSLPIEIRGTNRKEARLAALKELQAVGLEGHADKLPHQLSGGMQMRASLARSLVTQPELLLLDEPFASLDELTRRELLQQLSLRLHSVQCGVIFVSHSVSEAIFIADRLFLMSRAGRLIDLGPTGTDRSDNPINRLESEQLIALARYALARMESE